MKWLWLFLLCVAASAQQITITGTVKDPFGNPYANGSGRAVLVPNAQWTYLGGPVPNTIPISQLSSTGQFSVPVYNTGTLQPNGNVNGSPQWQFSFCNNGSTVCFTIAPLSLTTGQDISSTIQAQSTALPSTSGGNTNPGGVYYLSNNCTGVSNCTQIYGDGQSVKDATSTSTTTVTCPNSDCNFTQADVGKTFWGTTSANITFTTVVCPVTTIATVNSAQSVTLNTACTASGTANVAIYWGHRDGATLHALDSTVGCVAIQPFSGAVIFVDQALFIATPTCYTTGITQFTNVPQRDWVPLGSTVTLIMTPDFNYATCTGVSSPIATATCFGTGLSQMYNTLIWGTGLTPASNANCANASGKTIFALNAFGGFIDNFNIAGVCPGETGNGGVLNTTDEQWREGGAQNVMHNACVVAGVSINTYNLDCINDNGAGNPVGLWVTNNAVQTDIGTFSYDNALIDGGSTLKSHGTTFRSPSSGLFAITNNGIHISDGDIYQCNSSGEACVQISATGGTGYMSARNATFGGITGGVANAIVITTTGTTGAFYDGGGNTAIGGIAGCGSTTGTCYISGEQTLSAGCQGTVTASSTLGLYPYGQLTTPACTSTTVNMGLVMTRFGTAQGLNVLNATAGVNASSGVVTVLKNGVATTVTCTIGTATTGCRDFTHTFTYTVGDVISIQVTSQAADTLAGIKATVMVW